MVIYTSTLPNKLLLSIVFWLDEDCPYCSAKRKSLSTHLSTAHRNESIPVTIEKIRRLMPYDAAFEDIETIRVWVEWLKQRGDI